MRLRAQKVGEKTLHRYQQEIEGFKSWLKQKKQSFQLRRLDTQALSYITYLQEELDEEPNRASYLVYGLQLLHCQINKQDFLVNSKEALQAWKRRRPGNMRLPVPEEFIHDLAQHFLEYHRVDIAVALVLQMHCYLRPSEVLNLTTDHVCKPATRKYKHYAILVSPSSLGTRSKTGDTDDSVMIGDLPNFEWVGVCLGEYLKQVDYELFPQLSLSNYESALTAASRTLKYQPHLIQPHVLRHTGPSNDIYHKRRDLFQVMKRGRWKAKNSVRRYEKHALLIKQWEKADTSRHTIICARSQMLVSSLHQALRQKR